MFDSLVRKHPEYEYSVIVRTPDAAKKVTAQYPAARVVVGDLDRYTYLLSWLSIFPEPPLIIG